MRPSLLLMVLPVVLMGADCTSEQSPPANLDPDVPPVTDGDWYRPGVESTWQWQLQGTLNTAYGVDIYDVDLFDTSEMEIRGLQEEGRAVVCYFSGGSAEEWRSDFDQFLETDLGNPLAGWAGEYWIDVRSANVVAIMEARLDLAAQKGCDGVEPDNMDGYTNNTGFDETPEDQLAYNRHLANGAHQRGLAVALKNDLDQIPLLVDYFDLAVNEQCHEYDECDTLQPFIEAGKPVLNAEYPNSAAGADALAQAVCPGSLSQGLRTLILPLDLDDSFRVSCD